MFLLYVLAHFVRMYHYWQELWRTLFREPAEMDPVALLDTIRALSTAQKDSSRPTATMLPEDIIDTQIRCLFHQVTSCPSLKQSMEKAMETFFSLDSTPMIEPLGLTQQKTLLCSPWLMQNLDAFTRFAHFERQKMEADLLESVYHEWDKTLEKEWTLANQSLEQAASSLLKLTSQNCFYHNNHWSKLIDMHERACHESEKLIVHQQIKQEILEMQSLQSKYSEVAVASMKLQALCDMFLFENISEHGDSIVMFHRSVVEGVSVRVACDTGREEIGWLSDIKVVEKLTKPNMTEWNENADWIIPHSHAASTFYRWHLSNGISKLFSRDDEVFNGSPNIMYLCNYLVRLQSACMDILRVADKFKVTIESRPGNILTLVFLLNEDTKMALDYQCNNANMLFNCVPSKVSLSVHGERTCAFSAMEMLHGLDATMHTHATSFILQSVLEKLSCPTNYSNITTNA
jgi:hypothetical protein